jgi:hypothetical protein
MADDAVRRRSSYGRRAEWSWGKILVLASGVAAAVLAAFFLLSPTSKPTLEGAAADAPINAPVNVAGSTCIGGQSFYASPEGRPENAATLDAPIDLATALSERGPAKPCDTIWLRGGTYRGAFKSTLKGADNRPIVVRQYRGERATLDSVGAAEPALQVLGSWSWFWGFEVTNSDTQRLSKESGPWPSDLRRGTGVGARGPNNKFINLVVHDEARGFEVTAESIGTEIYGNLIYYNGWETLDGLGLGNGIDTQNQLGLRRIADNLIFKQFSHGIIASGKPLDNVTLTGNTIFSNGSISRKGVLESRNLLLGSGVVTNQPVVTDNSTYDGQANLGFDAGCADGTITGNYFSGPLVWVKCAGVMKDNVFYNPYATGYGYGPLPAQFPANTYHTTRPGGVVVRMRKNEYEPGRAIVTVYNWDKVSQVSVDPSDAGLAVGDRFEVRDAQNYFGPPVAAGIYEGGSINVPLTSQAVASPVGAVPTPPKSTLPEFGTFVILKAEQQSGT